MRRLSRNYSRVLLLCAAAALTACSGTPSTKLAKDAFEKSGQFYFFGKGQTKLVGFRKVNGMRSGDGTMYAFEYEATLECLKDWTFQIMTTDPRSCKPGETVKTTGTVKFVRTEKGWKPFF